MVKIKNKKNRGSVLGYMLVIMAVVMIILTSMIHFVISRINYSNYQADKEQSLQIAEAGIYFYRWYLAHEVEGKTASQVSDFWQNENPLGVSSNYEREFEDQTGNVIGKYSIKVEPPASNSTIVIIESTGWTYRRPGAARTLRVRFRRPSWSEYEVLCNANIRFGSGTEVFGPIHSNGGVHFDGVAHNIVSSSQETYIDPDENILVDCVWTSYEDEYNDDMESDVFLAGKEFPVATKDFNGVSADLALIKQVALDGTHGVYFGHSGKGQHIILKTNGTFSARQVNTFDPFTHEIKNYGNAWETYDIPEEGVIFVENNAWVEGSIDGSRVTIAAADIVGGSGSSLYVANDITYTNFDASDVVGLIAQSDFEVIRDSEDDLRIDAAIIAQNGRVGRDYYSAFYSSKSACAFKIEDGVFYDYREYCNGGPGWYFCPEDETKCLDIKDTITIYGAIATNGRYGFSWWDGIRNTGYLNRNLIYDNNLLYYPPPYFPVGSKYSLDLWEEL